MCRCCTTRNTHFSGPDRFLYPHSRHLDFRPVHELGWSRKQMTLQVGLSRLGFEDFTSYKAKTPDGSSMGIKGITHLPLRGLTEASITQVPPCSMARQAIYRAPFTASETRFEPIDPSSPTRAPSGTSSRRLILDDPLASMLTAHISFGAACVKPCASPSLPFFAKACFLCEAGAERVWIKQCHL